MVRRGTTEGLGREVKVRHPYKFVYVLDAVEKMPECFRASDIYFILPGRYFTKEEIKFYLKKAYFEGIVDRIGGGLWRRLDLK